MILPGTIEVGGSWHKNLSLPHTLIILNHREKIMSETKDPPRDVLCEPELQPILWRPILLSQLENCRPDTDITFTLNI